MSLSVQSKHVSDLAANGDVRGLKKVLTALPAVDRLKILSETNKRGRTVLHEAANWGDSEIVKAILECLSPADTFQLLSVQTNYGNTPLHFATQGAHIETVKCIVDSVPPADFYKLLHIPTTYGYTAIHSATLNKKSETVEYVLEKLTPPQCVELLTIKSKNGKTPVDVAKGKGHKEMVSCLEGFQKRSQPIGERASKEKHVQSVETGNEHSQQVTMYTKKRLVPESVTEHGLSQQVTGVKGGGEPVPAQLPTGNTGGTSGDSGLSSSSGGSSLSDLTEILKGIKLGEKLGSGGQSAVYKGTWLSSPVAVKMIPDSAGLDLSTTSLEHLEEYQAVKSLRHPYIVQYIGVTQVDMGIGLVMELCDTDLCTLSRSENKPHPQELLKIIKDAVCGLVYLHTLDLIHLDIKPHNILVQSGKGKLADFGLTDLTENFKDMAVTHSVWSGTPLYRAPELLHRAAPSKAADMWSMGITTLEVMTGAPPYKEMILYKRTRAPKDILDQKLPPVLQQMNERNQSIYKMVLKFDPSERMSVEDWLTKLDDYKL